MVYFGEEEFIIDGFKIINFKNINTIFKQGELIA